MPRRHAFEDVMAWFDERGCKLKTDHYENLHQTLEYECGVCNKLHRKSWLTARKLGVCGRIALTEDDLIVLFANKNKEYIEEVDRASNGKKRYRYKCHCGSVSITTLQDLEVNVGCGNCHNKRLKKSFDEIIKAFDELDLILESSPHEYETNQSKLRCLCKRCKFQGDTTYALIQQGKRPCGCNRKTGENSPLWNPNLTPEERVLRRRYPAYDAWRNAVYKRDAYTCQCCGARGGKIHAHHLYGYNDRIDKRTDIDNGVTLCRRCHDKFHGKYGRKNNTPEQFHEFKI